MILQHRSLGGVVPRKSFDCDAVAAGKVERQ
jgi:hypothetical protein